MQLCSLYVLCVAFSAPPPLDWQVRSREDQRTALPWRRTRMAQNATNGACMGSAAPWLARLGC